MSRIGLDVGTSQVKAVRFDEQWREVDAETEPTQVLRLKGGRREQSMPEVWQAAARVLRAVCERSPEPPSLVALTAQGDGCWLVDEAGEPVGHALLWNDNRASDRVDQWRRDGTLDAAFATSGSMGAPGLASAQLRWLAEHEPDRLARARHLLSCGSWVFSRLTGESVVERSDAVNPFGAARTGDYDDALLELFGLSEQRHLLAPLVSGQSAVAPVLPGAAHELGLAPGTPVVLAPYDVVATAIGCGVVEPETSFAVLGTTLCVGTFASAPHLERPPNGMTLPITGPAGDPTGWLLAYATLTGTEALDWAASVLGLDDAAAVVRLAARATREDPPVFLPYLSPAGERSPFLDPGARGGFTGLDLAHGPEDLARAVVEGLTFAVVECLRATPSPSSSLTVCGGGARSETWCQLLADASGVPVHTAPAVETGALGAALYGTAAVEGSDVTAPPTRSGSGPVRTPDESVGSALQARMERMVEVRRATS